MTSKVLIYALLDYWEQRKQKRAEKFEVMMAKNFPK